MDLAGLQGDYLNSSESKDSTRIDLRQENVAIDVDSGLLWLGFFRGVRVVRSGNFGRFVVFLALLRAWAVCRLAI